MACRSRRRVSNGHGTLARVAMCWIGSSGCRTLNGDSATTCNNSSIITSTEVTSTSWFYSNHTLLASMCSSSSRPPALLPVPHARERPTPPLEIGPQVVGLLQGNEQKTQRPRKPRRLHVCLGLGVGVSAGDGFAALLVGPCLSLDPGNTFQSLHTPPRPRGIV